VSELRIALLQVAAAGYDQAANLETGLAACRRAAGLGADIALFPEMWNIGYAFEGDDLERWRAQAVARDGAFTGRFARLAEELGMAIALTYLECGPDGPRNALTLFDRLGRETLTYDKVHTCAFDRPEAALAPGDGFPVAELDTAAGPLRLGAMICFDREFPEAARILALQGAELILVPNACEMEGNRLGQLRARAFENGCAVALANYPAPQQNGHSVVYDPMAFASGGESRETCVFEAGEAAGVFVAALDLGALREWRRTEVWGGAFRRPEVYGPLTDLPLRSAADHGGRPRADGPP
jgi:predicted amidohydrolase